MSDVEFVERNLPTGMPRRYRFDDELRFTRPPKSLDEAAANATLQPVAKQAASAELRSMSGHVERPSAVRP